MTPAALPARERGDAYWRRVGLQLGTELGQIDRNDGIKRRPDQLRIPPNMAEAYVTALREGYQASVTGTPLLSGDI